MAGEGEVVGEISSLGLYPLKATYVLKIEAAQCTETGFYLPELQVYDRHYAVLLPNGRAASLREMPRLTLIRPRLEGGVLRLTAPGAPELELPRVRDGEERVVRKVNVVGQFNEGVDCGDGAAGWISRVLQKEGCRLVWFSEKINKRNLKQDVENIFKPFNIEVPEEDPKLTFPDFGPYTLMSEASVADLNTRLEHPVSTLNFRPNIVVTGCEAYQEDTWKKLRMGSAEFRVFAMDPRCSATTVDPDTAERYAGFEPLKTLRKYRPLEEVNGVKYPYLAVYMLLTKPGEIKVGDQVYSID